ncbi:MAG: RNA polymerase sporulation sigma factor SigK [Clostridia bacterium]|nr:RNA polymerase sporulation sigma factor SigK [Clostridia bacterium]MBR6602974.1 RNA polymerase sporulation sigma factor SigK [Clostridia bacterium]
MLAFLLSATFKAACMILGIEVPQNFPPPLGEEEEKKYFEMKSMGDEKAREKLILHNLRLVSHIVRKYYSTSKESEDLVSVGTIGLVKAVDSFNMKNGARFATYGAKCIQNEILMYFRSKKKLAGEVSINETIDIDKDGNPLTYIDVISSEESMCEEVERAIRSSEARRLVDSILSEREKKIIYLRYGLSGSEPLPQREVAEKLGISRSYVSRIEKSALERLKEAMGD